MAAMLRRRSGTASGNAYRPGLAARALV